MLKKRTAPGSRLAAWNIPLTLFILCMALVSVGITSVYSASASPVYLTKQIIYALIGLTGLGVCYAIDYQWLKRISLFLLAISFVMCLLVFAPGIGMQVKGAHRWLRLGPLTIQPSEIAKLALIIYMAKMLSDNRQYLKSFFQVLFPAMLVTGVFAFVIVVEPDFGATFVLCCIIYGMWMAADMRLLHLAGLVVAMIPAGLIAFLSEPYRLKRLVAFMFRDKETIMGAGFQLHQSLIAVGSGGMWGLGLGQSHQKYHYLSEAQTDFIFAIICEEMGFLRVSCVIALFLVVTMIGWYVAIRATDMFGSLLASGITLMFVIGASINMGVVLGLLPTKGLVLPFISAGGSSLIVCMSAMGILMNVAHAQYSQRNYFLEKR